MIEREEKREEYAYVLDFMVSGKSFSNRSEPITPADRRGEVHAAGGHHKARSQPCARGAGLHRQGREGQDTADKVKDRLRRAHPDSEERAPDSDIQDSKGNEKRFVDIFNNAGPLNIRQHALELLPGIGKKHLEAILKARNEKKFESFADIPSRVQLLQDPAS